MTDETDPGNLLRLSFAQSAAVIARVAPDQMELPTPCTKWDVRTLIGHMLFAANRIGAAGRREALPQDGPAVTGLGDEEWAPAFDKSAQEALSAWGEPDALEGEIELPFGTFPSGVVASIYVMEQVTHAWDLARAIGTEGDLDPSLAEAILPFAHRMLPPESRKDTGGAFDSAVGVPEGAPVYEQLAGFLGRRPAARTSGERADLLASLASARHFLRFTTRGISDEQARKRTTVSELCLGGLVKHVAQVEQGWADFILEGPAAIDFSGEDAYESHAAGFRMLGSETLESLLADYEKVARRTDELVASLPDLDVSHALPEAPWFPPGARWSARRAILHVIAETAQHAGHADIIREALDGAKSMG